jgi:hypothetical protein
VEAYEAKMKALGKNIQVHWFDAGHGSLVVEQAIEHHELMLRFAARVIETAGRDAERVQSPTAP